LHAFVVLAEELHFGHAATRLGIAQPPLSRQIRRLEDKVGYPLFSREPGRIGLTPAGRDLLPAARHALTGLAAGLTAARKPAVAGPVACGSASPPPSPSPSSPACCEPSGNGLPPWDIQEMTTAVEWQTVCALVETGLGVSLAPESIRRIRLEGVASRRIEPDTARTRIAVAWRKSDPNPLVPSILAAPNEDPPDRP
jgi:DNA-binding transcriptional LysR family regulator